MLHLVDVELLQVLPGCTKTKAGIVNVQEEEDAGLKEEAKWHCYQRR